METTAKVTYARESIDVEQAKRGSIFLAGPTPRSNDVVSWRPEALRMLEEHHYDGIVLVPEDRSGIFRCEYSHQVEWEEQALKTTCCILFWFARKLPDMPAFTTNDEWGRWKYSGKVVFGAPAWAEKVTYQRYYARKLGVPMAETLSETISNAIEMDRKWRFY